MDKKYYKCHVVSHSKINIQDIKSLLERNTWTDPEVDNSVIPARKINCKSIPVFSNRAIFCELTKKEIQKLRNDSRILGIDIIPTKPLPPEEEYKLNANYNDTPGDNSLFKDPNKGNPALYYINNVANDAEAAALYFITSSGAVYKDLNVNRQGENVDVVVSDSKYLNISLPDYYDDRGNNRVIAGYLSAIQTIRTHWENFDWANEVIFSPSTGNIISWNNSEYKDLYDTHRFYLRYGVFNHPTPDINTGNHSDGVASTCAGAKYGLAKKSNIIPIPKISSDSFEPELAVFHMSKSLNPKTNRRNPTLNVRSVGGGSISLFNSFLRTGSMVSASVDLNFMENGTGFRINHAGHDIVFTSSSSTSITSKVNSKYGSWIIEYNGLDIQEFVNKINDSEVLSTSVSYNSTVTSATNRDRCLSMFSASYNNSTNIFSITSSYGLPNNVRIYTGTLAQLTGSDTPSGGHFYVKLTGSLDPYWAIKDWAPNGTPLNLGGINTYPKNEYGFFIRSHDHHGIINDSIYPWVKIYTNQVSFGAAVSAESTTEFRDTSNLLLAADEELSNLGVILVNSGGNRYITEYKSASLDSPYYRPEYNVPASHPYNTYFVLNEDVEIGNTQYFEDDKIYPRRHHNHVSVIDAGDFDIKTRDNSPLIKINGGRGNALDIFAPGNINVAQGYATTESVFKAFTSSLFVADSESFYNGNQLFTHVNKNEPLTSSIGLHQITESINNNFTISNRLITTKLDTSSWSADTANVFNDNFFISSSSTSRDIDTRIAKIKHFHVASEFVGTSAACPLVGGVLALYLEENPEANVIDCKDFLRNTACVNNIIPDFDVENTGSFHFDFSTSTLSFFTASIVNGLVEVETVDNILRDSPNRILANPYNTEYRNIIKTSGSMNIKGNLRFKNF